MNGALVLAITLSGWWPAGSGTPHTDKVGSVTAAQVREIAQTKMPDLNANTIEAAEKIIAGTARSMGITVKD